MFNIRFSIERYGLSKTTPGVSPRAQKTTGVIDLSGNDTDDSTGVPELVQGYDSDSESESEDEDEDEDEEEDFDTKSDKPVKIHHAVLDADGDELD